MVWSQCEVRSSVIVFSFALWRRCRLRAPASCCCPESEREMAPMERRRKERGLGKSPDAPWWVSCHGPADSLYSIRVQATLAIYIYTHVCKCDVPTQRGKVRNPPVTPPEHNARTPKTLSFSISSSIWLISFNSLILVVVNRKLVSLMMVSDDDDNGLLGTEAPRTFLRWPWTCG